MTLGESQNVLREKNIFIHKFKNEASIQALHYNTFLTNSKYNTIIE